MCVLEGRAPAQHHADLRRCELGCELGVPARLRCAGPAAEVLAAYCGLLALGLRALQRKAPPTAPLLVR